MIGPHELFTSPSVAGRGGDSIDQRQLEQQCSVHRRNIWARWPFSGLTQHAQSTSTTTGIRQRFKCTGHSTTHNRQPFHYRAQQLCNDGAVCKSGIGRWRTARLRNQLATSRRGSEGIFISSGWPARYAYGYIAGNDCTAMVGTS